MQIISRQFLLAFVAGVFTCLPLYGQDRTRAWERRQSLEESQSFPVSVEKESSSYYFSRFIAEGSFGSVDLVYRQGIRGREFFAQKKYNRPPHRDMEVFVENMTYLKSLQHPNIVAIKGMEYPFLIMEYLAGEELATVLDQHSRLYKNSKEYEVEKKILLRQLFSSLQFLEENRVYHFDVKPENFVFKNPLSTELKIVDFDFMSRCPNEEEEFRFCGTPCFFSPELLYQHYRGMHCDQSKRDMWAAGLLANEILSGVEYEWGITEKVGSTGYKKQLELEIMDHTEMNLPIGPVPLDPDVKELLLHLLVKDPKKRWTASQAFSSPYFILPEYTEPEEGVEIVLVPQHDKIRNLLKGKPLTMRVSTDMSVSALMDQIMLKYGIRKSAFSVSYENHTLDAFGRSKGVKKKIWEITQPLENYNIQEGSCLYLEIKDRQYDP